MAVALRNPTPERRFRCTRTRFLVAYLYGAFLGVTLDDLAAPWTSVMRFEKEVRCETGIVFSWGLGQTMAKVQQVDKGRSTEILTP